MIIAIRFKLASCVNNNIYKKKLVNHLLIESYDILLMKSLINYFCVTLKGLTAIKIEPTYV